ncbi:MAG: SH3 domain-containing protein [Spirochaetes bacterium]|nr:SH3 domain-containing protein [Spirochaetota bacterium]
MLKNKQKIIFLAFLILIISVPLFSDFVIITIDRAYLKSSPTSFSGSIKVLTKNASLILLEKKGSWLKVQTKKGEVGWLNKIAIQKRASFSGYGGQVKNELNITAAAFRAIELEGENFTFSEDVLNMYLTEDKKAITPLLQQLERTQKKEDPHKKYQSFRKEGQLGEFQE